MTLGPTIRKTKYLNNRDLLAEIHRSKCSYSSFTDPEFSTYDIILPALDKVNIRTVAEAKRNRAKRLGLQAFTAARLAGDKKIKLAEVTPDYKTIQKTDVIIRIMTFDHIPLNNTRKKNPKSQADHRDKVNFPPFQHYKIDENNTFHCVGKSHWKGDLTDGEFSKDHGNITNKLARMYIMMCEKYAMKFNWRGYTYNDEMRNSAILQLTYVGLRFNEAKSQNPFAYYTAAITNSFCRVLNSEKRNQNIRDDILEMNGLNPSWTRQGTSSTVYEE